MTNRDQRRAQVLTKVEVGEITATEDAPRLISVEARTSVARQYKGLIDLARALDVMAARPER
jgi:hypothetical protein